jgi:hypothetical protein
MLLQERLDKRERDVESIILGMPSFQFPLEMFSSQIPSHQPTWYSYTVGMSGAG